MSMALLLTLLLPVLQDDPQVTYREGLFEEVDQGNLEKAAELYGRVLKSGAPDALKAKALLRTGFCHEKKGRKKEAEQAWRDVIERYPGASETAKLARERLMAGNQSEGGPSLSLDTQVQNLILDLGSEDGKIRGEAIRKLALLGETVIPEVRRALLHKDQQLSSGAASVLIRLESLDGVYDGLRRGWTGKKPAAYPTIMALGELLKVNEEARYRFLKEIGDLNNKQAISSISGVLCTLPGPAFPKLVEDWILNEPEPSQAGLAMRAWAGTADETAIVRMVERLTTSGPTGFTKLIQLAGTPASNRFKDAKCRAAVAKALESWPDLTQLVQGEQGFASLIFQYIDPIEFAEGLLKSWFKRASPEVRGRIIECAQNWARYPEYGAFKKFLLEQMASPEVPQELRNQIYSKIPEPASPDEREKLISFGLLYLKEYRSKPEVDRPMLPSVVHRLLELLPDDSRELAYVLDVSFDCLDGYENIPPKNRAANRRSTLVASALRAVKRQALAMKLALLTINGLGTPAEKVEIGSSLASWPKEDKQGHLEMAAANYCVGVLDLPEGERDAAWKSLLSICAKGDSRLQVALAQGCVGRSDFRVDAFMKDASASPDESLRWVAINHWENTGSAQGIPGLIRALDDKSDSFKQAAIDALGKMRALDAVPALIRFLEGSPGELRDSASKALQLIRKHYEERAEWQRWYDDIKKTLKK